MSQVLTAEEAKRLVESVSPRLGYDHTYPPKFAEGRQDVAVVERSLTNGSTYGYTIIYVVVKTPEGEIRYRELIDSSSTKDNLFPGDVRVEADTLKVEIRCPGSYSGSPWERTLKIPLSGLGL